MARNSKAGNSNGSAHRKPAPRWELRLYVADWEPRSAAAWAKLQKLCEEYLHGLYRIEVIDLLKTPKRAGEDQIVALPTVVRHWPQPERRTVGSLSDSERAVSALELRGAQ